MEKRRLKYFRNYLVWLCYFLYNKDIVVPISIFEMKRGFFMKKHFIAFGIAICVLLSVSMPAQASSSTYRSQLSQSEREIYDAMSSYLSQGYDSFSWEFSDPPVYSASGDINSSLKNLVGRAYEAFYRDYPEVFWIDKSGFSFSPQYEVQEDSVVITGFSMRVSFAASPSQSSALDQAAASILQGASGTDAEKARYFHDSILSRCSYKSGAASSYDPMSCEAYGALVEGSAICEGYAKALKLLCNRAGIPCEIVGGTVNGEAHMWNYVQIDGAYYLVDATFDDSPGVGTYDYFLKGSSSVWDHLEDSSLLEGFSAGLFYPALSSSDYAGGADNSGAGMQSGQNASLAGGEDLSGSDTAAENGSDTAQSRPVSERHPAAVVPVKEGYCRVSCLFAKNGRYWVKASGSAGFARGKQDFPAGAGLQVFAFPNPGYRVAEITITSKESVISVQNGSSAPFSLEQDSQIRVRFEKVN